MNLIIKAIGRDNRENALKLKVAEGQEGFIEDVAECLSEADRGESWRPVGIYDGDTLVGFAMYGFFKEYKPAGRVWMDRLLIDAGYQGKGYGTEAMKLLISRLSKEYGCSEIYLSVVEGNETAARLYERFGFKYTGEKDTHGEDVMVLRL